MTSQPLPTATCLQHHVAQATSVPDLRPLAARLTRHGALVDRDEALGALHLAWVETQLRHDPARGASPLTYAWQRLTGRCADLRRGEARRLRLLGAVAGHPTPVHGATPATLTGPRTDRIAMRQALQRVGALSSAEALVLHGHYEADRSLGELAAASNHSADSLQRAHRKLLGRLRAVLEVPA